jgi:hypothetical protein
MLKGNDAEIEVYVLEVVDLRVFSFKERLFIQFIAKI